MSREISPQRQAELRRRTLAFLETCMPKVIREFQAFHQLHPQWKFRSKISKEKLAVIIEFSLPETKERPLRLFRFTPEEIAAVTSYILQFQNMQENTTIDRAPSERNALRYELTVADNRRVLSAVMPLAS